MLLFGLEEGQVGDKMAGGGPFKKTLLGAWAW